MKIFDSYPLCKPSYGILHVKVRVPAHIPNPLIVAPGSCINISSINIDKYIYDRKVDSQKNSNINLTEYIG